MSLNVNDRVDEELSDLRNRIHELLQTNSAIQLLSLIDNVGTPILTVTRDEKSSLSSDHQKRLTGAVAAAVALANRAMRVITSDSSVSMGLRTERGNVGIVKSDNFILLLLTDHKTNARLLALQAERILREHV